MRHSAPGDSTHGWKALFYRAFDRSANPMALLQSDRVLVAINPAFAEDLGYPPEDAVGQRADIFIAKASRARLDFDWARLRRTGHLSGERELVRSDGRQVRVQFAAHTEQITGQLLVLYVVLDLTLHPMELQVLPRTPQPALTPR